MSILAPFRSNPAAKFPDTLDQKISGRLRRGRAARDKDKTTRELCRRFWAGDQYWLMQADRRLTSQISGPPGVIGKAGNRVRNTYNFVQLIVEGKVSAATQQLPGYEISAASTDPDDADMASLASQVAAYGYDQWRLRRHRTKAVTNAFVQREGFVAPYFDPNIGPFTRGEDGEMSGRGEIKHLSLNRDQVMWEPGEDFDDSRWHAIERSLRVEVVKELPGYVIGSLEQAKQGTEDSAKVTLTEYQERPCPDYPDGRRIFVVAEKVVVDYRKSKDGEGAESWWEPFPFRDADETVIDEPAIHRISYTVNPDSDGDDFGLVERIIDLQRTINDTWNKILEIKNRALLLQMFVPKGSSMPRRDDTPGATYEYNAAAGEKPIWENAPDPALLSGLLTIHQEAISELRSLSSDVDVQPEPRLSADTANIAQTSSAARWASFLGDLADFDSRLMRHDLVLVARFYDVQRQVEIRGQYGWETPRTFSGQDLQSQVNVKVAPETLAVKSRAQRQQEIQWLQANFPGAITPEAALAFINGGKEEGFLTSYRQHTAKAWRIVQRLKSGPEAMEMFGARFDPTLPDLSAQQVIDPMTGTPMPPPLGVDVPGWMPGPQDNSKIWRQVICDYMVTQDFEQLDQAVQENFYLILQGLDQAEQERAARQAMMQDQQAMSLGTANAAKPQMAAPLPDRAGFTPENESPTPNTT